MRLVWTLAHHSTNTTKAVFEFKNPINTVRLMLAADQWARVAFALVREVAWCQERYCELMVCRLSQLPIAVTSHRLVENTTGSTTTGVSNTTTASSAGSTTTAPSNNYLSATPASINTVEDCVSALVDTVATRYEKETLPTAHKVFCGYAHARFVKQPRLTHNKLVYLHNGQLLFQTDYPWAGRRVLAETNFKNCVTEHYANHRQLWTDAVLLCARLINTLKQCVLRKTGILQELKDCSRLFYSTPMPADYVYFDTQNRSEVLFVCEYGVLCIIVCVHSELR